MSHPTPVPVGKGRPTPKRRVAEKRRAPVTAPTNRKDAARQARDRRANQRNDARKALVSGDESALPARDRGPLRRFIRDWVDSKRTLSEYMLPFLAIFLAISVVASGSTRSSFAVALNLLVLVLLVELGVFIVLLRRAIHRAFPEGGPGSKGALRYGALRLASLRMFRLPKPAVKRGDSPRPVR